MAMLGAECSGCCEGWWCYGATCANMVLSVRARIVSFPEATSDTVDSGSAFSAFQSSVSEVAARDRVALAYNSLRGTYRLRSQPTGAWITLQPSSSANCSRCEYTAVNNEPTAIPLLSEWKVIVDVCDATSCVSVVAYQLPTRLSVEYAVPEIASSDSRIRSQENAPGFGALRYSAYLDDTAFTSGGSCSYSNNSPSLVHQNASGGSAVSSFVDYATAGIGSFPAVRLVQPYATQSVLSYQSTTQTNGGTQSGSNQSTAREWTSAVNGVRCTRLVQLQQATTIEIEVTTR